MKPIKFIFFSKGFAILGIAILTTFLICSSSLPHPFSLDKPDDSNAMTIRLELFTSNLSKTVRFYRDVLGFQLLKAPGTNYQLMQKGQVVLGIGLLNSLGDNHYFNSYPPDNQVGYGVEIVLEVEDIQLIYNKVKLTNAEVESELKQQAWGLTDFRLIDPNGYYIRVTSKN